MSRRHLSFDCDGLALAGTLDEAPGSTGLLIVSGGTEPRCGAWGGQAEIAAAIAAAGFPAFRFDRRGVGDSEGYDFGFADSAADIAAALAGFRSAAPQLTRVIAYGNCDAASALMLAGGAGCDGLALANPWTIEDADAPPPPAEIRAHYKRRLTDRAALRRLLRGEVRLGAMLRSLRQGARAEAPPPARTLADALAEGIAAFAGPVRFLLAGRDRTADAFRAAWPAGDARVLECPGATHGFVEQDARRWRIARLTEMLAG